MELITRPSGLVFPLKISNIPCSIPAAPAVTPSQAAAFWVAFLISFLLILRLSQLFVIRSDRFRPASCALQFALFQGAFPSRNNKSSRYHRIIGNLISAKPKFRFKKIKMVFSTPPHAPEMSRHFFEATFSSSVRLMHSLTGKDLCPVEVTFIYPEPASTAECERIFQCPIHFGHKHNSLSIHPGIINTPIRLANPDLKVKFENYTREFLAQMDLHKKHSRQVTKISLANLDDDSLTIKDVAREMSVSVRTLQNYLREEGVAFTDLLLDIRERLAKQYLRQDYSVEEITYLLGYSEPSVFRKAFKHWLGVTPRQFREHSTLEVNAI
jgi:AraC-like DNA-binding protein